MPGRLTIAQVLAAAIVVIVTCALTTRSVASSRSGQAYVAYCYVVNGAGGVATFKEMSDGNLVAVNLAGPSVFGFEVSSLTASPRTNVLYIIGKRKIMCCNVTREGRLRRGKLLSVPFDRGDDRRLVFTPNGRFAFLANHDDKSVSAFAVGLGGELSSLSPNRKAFPDAIDAVVISTDGRYCYAETAMSDRLYQYRIGNNGALRGLEPPTVPIGVYDLALDPTGRLAFGCGSELDRLCTFTITDGRLSLASQIAASSLPHLEANFALRRVYFMDGPKFVQFHISDSGELDVILGTNPTDANASLLSTVSLFDNVHGSAYGIEGGAISELRVSADGALSQLTSELLIADDTSIDIFQAFDHKCLYVKNRYLGTISVLNIGEEGRLVSNGKPSVPAKGFDPKGSPLGTVAFVRADR